MHEARFVRQELTDRLDVMALLIEQVATEAIEDGALELATDLWVASARVSAAAEELARSVRPDTC